MGRGPGSSQTGDRRQLAPVGISTLLEVAIASTCWQTESYCRNSGADPPPGRRESDLGGAQDPWRTQKLGFVVSERTVARYLQRVQRRGDPGKSWLTFLINHQEVIAAFDFFTVPTLTFHVLYCFFVIEHGRWKILHFNVTRHPTAGWVVQQLREAFPEAGPYRYVILDRDAKFDGEVVALLQGTGLKPKRTGIRSPWQNSIAERWVGSCRRELLDHVIPLNEQHLRRLVRDYVVYYQEDRIHDALGKDTPNLRAIEKKPSAGATVISSPRLGGLHHRYSWREAA